MTLKAIATESLSASGITIGTSVITGGTDTRVLFDDAGVVGESAGLTYLKATGKLSVGLTGSAAAWTTGGVRIVANAVSYTDTSSSGTVATAYSDIYGATTILASSATTYTQYYGAFFKAPVASTNVTMTNKSALGADTVSIGGAAQGSNALAVTGTTSLGATSFGGAITGFQNATFGTVFANGVTGNGAPLVLNGSGSVQLGLGDAAVAVAQTFRVQSVVAGTAAANGANWTLIGSLPTGTGTSGDIIIQTGVKTGSGTTQGTATTALTIKGETQAITIASGKSLVLGNSASTGLAAGVLAALTNASLVITDASGQAYRIPCII